MSQTQTTDTENKTHIPDSSAGAMIGEEEYIAASSSGDIAKIASGDNPPLKPDNVLALQRQLGNQATLKIVNRQPLTQQNSDANPFAGLKMVTPGTIQREDEDEVITRSNAMEQEDEDSDADNDPDKAVELDSNDNEVQQESDEIDQTISQAQQIPGLIRTDSTDSDIDDNNDDVIVDGTDEDEAHDTGQGGAPSSDKPMMVDISDEDSDDDNDHENDYYKNQAKGGFSAIAKHKGHKQKQGTHIKGHYLASDSLGMAATQLGTDTARNTGTVVEAAQAGVAIKSASSLKEALVAVGDTSKDAGSDGISGLLDKVATFFDVPPMNVILPIATLIYRIYSAVIKHKQMKAFKALMGNNGGSVKDAKKRSTALADKGTIGAYGFAKTKRGFWLRVIKAAINVGQVLARLITIISGGTAALISEATNTALALSNGIIKVGQSLKGIYKMITGKRGKRRTEGANWIVDAAIDGDQEMLQFMIDGEALSKAYLEARRRKFVDEAETSTDKDHLAKLELLSKRPKTTDEMKTYLQTAEELNTLVAVKNQVAIMTKST